MMLLFWPYSYFLYLTVYVEKTTYCQNIAHDVIGQQYVGIDKCLKNAICGCALDC